MSKSWRNRLIGGGDGGKLKNAEREIKGVDGSRSRKEDAVRDRRKRDESGEREGQTERKNRG